MPLKTPKWGTFTDEQLLLKIIISKNVSIESSGQMTNKTALYLKCIDSSERVTYFLIELDFINFDSKILI